MRAVTEKDVLKFMRDGPTLEELAKRISREFSEEVSPGSVGDILVALQDKDCVFLEEGRWWRTPEGVILLEKLLVEEEAQKKEAKEEPKPEPMLVLAKKTWRTRRDLIAALAIALVVLVLKVFFSCSYLLPIWDGAVYLLNARRFLYGYDPFSFFELLRPPLLPYVISLLWSVLGESYLLVMPIQSIFTVLAGPILYIVVREMFDWKTAMLSLIIFLFNPVVFVWTDQLLTHGIQLVFTLLCIFFAWRTYSDPAGTKGLRDILHAVFVGLFAALTSLTRYPAIVFFPAALVLALRRDVARNVKWLLICGFSFVATWTPWFLWNMQYAGGDPFASVKAGFIVGAYIGEPEPWYHYLTGLIQLISVIGVMLLLAGMVSKESFKDRKRLMFLAWFAIATAAHSALLNKQLRFTIEWFPAISVLIALGARRIQGLLSFRPRIAFNVLIASWLIYLIGSSIFSAVADVNERNGPATREFPTVVSWITANMARDEIGASDSVFTPQLAYFSKRLFYNFEFLQEESKAKGVGTGEYLRRLNVTYVVVTSWYAQLRSLNGADYLVMVKKFQNFAAYAVMKEVGSKHLGILLVGNHLKMEAPSSQLLSSRLAIQNTVRGVAPLFDAINSSSFFTRLEDTYADDERPKHGLIVLLEEVWNEASRTLSLNKVQLSVLKRLVEERGVALLTFGRSTEGWLLENYGIRSSGTSTFRAFQITESKNVADWSNLLGYDKAWNLSTPSQLAIFSASPPSLEAIVETDRRAIVWAGHQGKGRVAHFCCSALDLAFDQRMNTVNPVLVRLLFWLLGDYPKVVKGTGFKVALRIDDAHAGLYSSIERHAQSLVYERGLPLSFGVIPKDLSRATSDLLLRLKERGCELALHGCPGHYDLAAMADQTPALFEGKELFKTWLGFYPTILIPPGLSYNYETVRAAQAVGLKAISGSTVDSKPPGTRGNHFGYPYGNSTVVMLPSLPLLDYGPYGEWLPSVEIAIARTKWLLACQKWLHSSCIVTWHFNDTRLPDIVRLVDWIRSIGAEFTTMERMVEDTYMSLTLEQYSPYADMPSFADFDMLENGGKISFTLNHPIKLRIDAGKLVAYCRINGKIQVTKGSVIVTEILESGKEHTILIYTQAGTSYS